MLLCKYRHIFGKEKEGVHSIRMFNIAIVDLGLTLLFTYYISKKYNYNFVYLSLSILCISVIVHKLFCVETTLTTLLFSKD